VLENRQMRKGAPFFLYVYSLQRNHNNRQVLPHSISNSYSSLSQSLHNSSLSNVPTTCYGTFDYCSTGVYMLTAQYHRNRLIRRSNKPNGVTPVRGVVQDKYVLTNVRIATRQPVTVTFCARTRTKLPTITYRKTDRSFFPPNRLTIFPLFSAIANSQSCPLTSLSSSYQAHETTNPNTFN
jgi:hypothetical protein